MTNEEFEKKLKDFQNEIGEHAEFICFLKPKDRKEEFVMIHGVAPNLAAVIAITRIQNNDVREILKISNLAFEKFKNRVQP